MNNDIVIFWCILFYALFGLVMTLKRNRMGRRGWVAIYVGVVIAALFGEWGHKPFYLYLAIMLWVVLILVPALMARVYSRRMLQQQYAEAWRMARIMTWLHPMDGFRELPQIVHALDLAQRGHLPEAVNILERFQDVQSPIGASAIAHLYRLANRWQELLDWQHRHPQVLERMPQLLPVILRACGEIGDVRRMVEWYDRQQHQIRLLAPASARDHCRLMLFAFGGRRDLAERLLLGSGLAALPASTRAFWLATADQAAGAEEPARRQFELLLTHADASLRAAVTRRLTQPLAPAASLDPALAGVIESAAVEHRQEESFGTQRPLLSRHARATQIILGLNLLMYGLEICQGGGNNPESIYRLGGMYPPDVRAGQWWRLVTSMFLHFGPLHLGMNMLALWVLGPFMEFAVGFRRFLLVYLLSGLGSSALVFALSSGPTDEQLFAGASGCIMGLVGATGALMLRGWLTQKALTAKRRLMGVVLIMATQTVFDSMVPQVSMTAHLSGALIGFIITLLLRHRLTFEESRR